MPINRVDYDGRTLIDISDTDVNPYTLGLSKKVYGKDGSPVYGQNPYEKTATDATVETQAGLISEITTVLAGKGSGEGGIVPSGTKVITTNGTHDVTSYATAEVNVDNAPALETLTVTPTESEQNFTPSSGYDGYSSVKVNAVSSTYVGSGVTKQAAQTITPGTSNKTIDSGRYLTGTQTIAGDTDLVAGNIKKGVTIFNVTGTYEGATASAPVIESLTVTPSTTEQTFNKSGIDGYYPVTVNAVATATQATPTITVGTGGKITATSTQSEGYVASGTKTATKQLTVQAAQTIKPGTSDQTISSGIYLTGVQTILGDANLVPGNIKEGVTIFDVLGTFAGSGGSNSPSGGIPDGFSALTGGTLTPASDTADGGLNYINHDLSATPNFFIIAMNCTVSPADHAGYLLYSACFKSKIGNNEVIGYTTRTASNGSMSQSIMNYPGMGSTMFTDTQFSTFGSGTSMKAGVEYAWLCGVLDNLV